MIYETASMRRKVLAVWGGAVAVVAITSLIVIFGYGYLEFETRIIRAVNGMSDSLQPLFLFFTLLGSEYVLGPILIILWYIRRYRTALLSVIAAGAVYVIARLMKRLIESERPYVALVDIHQRATELTFAFPSGHTSFAAAIATVLVLEFSGKWKWIACLWISGVALSRIYLGVHSVLDVIGGAALGVAVGISVHFVLPHLRQKTRAFLLAIRGRTR